jgi:carboxymethylenebutenolidase
MDPDSRTTTLTERFEIVVDDRANMALYLARPASGEASGGVIVACELFGVSAHVRDVCEHLAALGYLAVAPDLYHRSAAGLELAHDAAGRERGFELLGEMTRDQALRDVGATAGHLRNRGCGRVGILGLSVGGHVAYLAATEPELDVAATAVVYGGWIPTTDIPISRPQPTLTRTPAITGRVLVLVGENDQVVPPDQRQAIGDALRDAKVRHELVEYSGATHGFLSDRRDAFDPAAAADAWGRIAGLFADELR